MRVLLGATIALAVLVLGSAHQALAAPFTLQTVLTGDPRPSSPDDLLVQVTIQGDTDSNVTHWIVDLDMAAVHPFATLDQFGFNLLGSASNYSFSGLNLPYTPFSGVLNGSGGATFMMNLEDPNGHANDASNLTNLTFMLTSNAGNFSPDLFLLASPSCSNDVLLGCGQMGAHVQRLGANASGSGVALAGNYASVPEPGTLALLSVGACFAAIRRRRGSKLTAA